MSEGEDIKTFIAGRELVYGEAVDCFTRIAKVWSGILGHEVQPVEVPLCMIGLKAVRAQISPDYSDNSDDIEGFLDIFRSIVGEDMIHAKLASEYLKEKEKRAYPLITREAGAWSEH